jgi:hypothetical protein
VYVGAAAGSTRPLRVSVSGSAPSAAAAAVPFHGVLDVFHYNVGAQPDSLFNLTAMCGAAAGGSGSGATAGNGPTPIPGTGSSSSGGADTNTAVTVLMVLIIIAVVGAVGWFLYTRWHNHSAREAHQRKAAIQALRQGDKQSDAQDVELAFDGSSQSRSQRHAADL